MWIDTGAFNMRTAIWFWWTLAYAFLAIAGLLPRRTFSFLNDDTFAIEDSGKAFVASSAPEGACAMVQPAVNKFLQDKPKGTSINRHSCPYFFKIATLRKGGWCLTLY